MPVLAVGPDGTVYYAPPPFAASGLVARRPDGTTLWQRDVGVVRIAVADDGTVLVLSGGGVLHAFSPDGSERWSVVTAPGAGRMAVGADGSAYVVGKGVVVAVGPEGGVRWTYRGVISPADPIIGGDGTIYLGGASLVALRPDGSRAWQAKGISQPLVPEAIGSDGTLYAETSPLNGPYATPGGTLFAFAGPSAPAGVRIPAPGRRRHLISGLRVAPRRFRAHGAESLCTPGRGCRPADPLGATVSFTVTRDAVVSVVVRRACDRGVVTRFSRRVRAGTMWRSFSDVTNYRSLAPGRYTVTAAAARGTTRSGTGPVPVRIVR